MDLLPVGLLILVVALGGVIAYFADQLGRTLGKKRLSVLGLRPRHTAAVLTVGAGMLIPFLTIMVVYGASHEVRVWVTEGRQAIVQRDRAIGEVRDATERLKRASEEINDAMRRSAELQEKNQEVESQLNERTAEVDRLEGRVASLQGSEQGLRTRLGSTQRQFDQARTGLIQAQRELGGTRQRLQGVQRELGVIVAEKDATEEAYEAAQVSFRELTKQKNDADAAVLEAREDVFRLEVEKADLEAQRADLHAAVRDTEARLNDVNEMLVQATVRRMELDSELKASQHFLATTFGPSRMSPMIYRLGEEVARVTVPPGLSLVEAEGVVDRLARNARTAAEERGARGRGLDYPAAGIFERTDGETGRTVGTQELRRLLAERLVGHEDPQVLVAYSSLNAFQGEPVSLEVGLFPNPVVYREGQVVAESRIDGQRQEKEIFRQLSEFIGTQIRERAKRDNMIARRGSDESFGQMTPDEMLDLVALVRAADRPVRLVAVATSDTRAGDPLRLQFRIR
jgi:uncharacterized protein (DUF3084 family)